MDPWEGEERRGRRRGAGLVELCSSCHCLQTCVNALLKCLGFEFEPGSTAMRCSDGHNSQAPRRDTDEGEEEYDEEERRWRPWQRRPTRPPISTGSGGQTN